MEFLVNPKFDLIGKRKPALIGSAILILAGLISLIVQGGPNYGIDFVGGTSLELQFEKAVSIADIRDAVSGVGFENAVIKNFGADNEIIIRVEEQGREAKPDSILQAGITQSLPDNPYVVQRSEAVGPKIGSELRRAAILAVLVALLFILLYISWRFEFVFAVGAIAALFHDVVITLGVFSILRLEISLAIIAAFLTIVGYSINDTIVVFDRIRENLKVLRRESYENIVNSSLNQSLSRTVVTSVTTLMVVLTLYIFGGEMIHNFAFALIIGVLVGTYSSIFIASPIVLEWEKKRSLKKSRRPAAKRA